MRLKVLNSQFIKVSEKPLVRDTLRMLISNGLKLFVQAAYFIVIARALGVQDYGAFLAITSLAKVIAPFATWGSGDILIKHVSRNKAVFAQFWGNYLFIILILSSILTAFVLLFGTAILPRSVSQLSVILILFSELLCTLVIDGSAKAFLSINQMKRTAQINILISLKNLVAALILIYGFEEIGLTLWTVLYFSTTLAAALICLFLVTQKIGSPKLSLSRIKTELAQGFYFSVSLSAETINHNMDKAMLARLSTLKATGIYGAAYRLIDVTFVPVQSLMVASYAKFFQKGRAGISGSLKFSVQLSLIASLYGIVAGLALFSLAPIVPFILGNEYATAVEALRWLSPLPFLLALQFFAADTLTGAGFQGTRSVVQVAAALFNFLTNLWLIPLYSWRGAAWSSLASDGLKMLVLWLLVFLLYRREIKAKQI